MMINEVSRRFSLRAPDGVEIAGAESGEGPGLVFVYGAMMAQDGWARLLPYLQQGRTLYTYDRRGRGDSSDFGVHTVQREVDDLLAVTADLPRPLDLFAHSSGALLALHAVSQGMEVRRLVLYEPPLGDLREPQLTLDLPDRILALAREGKRHEALELFMREGMALDDDDLDRIRGGDRWLDQMRYAATGAYDVRITRTYALDPARLAKVQAPTLLLVGSQSPDWMRRGVETFAEALPDARLEVIEGHGHNAQFSAPDLLAEKIAGFLE